MNTQDVLLPPRPRSPYRVHTRNTKFAGVLMLPGCSVSLSVVACFISFLRPRSPLPPPPPCLYCLCLLYFLFTPSQYPPPPPPPFFCTSFTSYLRFRNIPPPPLPPPPLVYACIFYLHPRSTPTPSLPHPHWSADFEVTGMTRPRKNLVASGIRTTDLPLPRRTP